MLCHAQQDKRTQCAREVYAVLTEVAKICNAKQDHIPAVSVLWDTTDAFF